jgi:hypothetical protein
MTDEQMSDKTIHRHIKHYQNRIIVPNTTDLLDNFTVLFCTIHAIFAYTKSEKLLSKSTKKSLL